MYPAVCSSALNPWMTCHLSLSPRACCMQLQLTQGLSQAPRKRTCFSFFCDLCEHEHAKNDCVLVGVRILRGPFTAERIWRAMREAQ